MATASDSTPATITIPLTRGYSTVIDACDADLCAQNWCVGFNGKRHDRPIARRTDHNKGASRQVILHRVIMQRMAGRQLERRELVDHIDGNPLNNTRANLRIATTQENTRNSGIRKTNSSGFMGIWKDKERNTWRAEISINGVKHRLGTYKTPEEAHVVWLEQTQRIFGEFAPPPERTRRG